MNKHMNEKFRKLRAAAAREAWLSTLMRLFFAAVVSVVAAQLMFEELQLFRKAIYMGAALVVAVMFAWLDRRFYLMAQKSQTEAEVVMYGDVDAKNSNSAKMEQ